MSAKQHRPSAVVFDLDGVLIDSAACHSRAFEKVFAPFGILDFDYRGYAGWKTADVVENVLRRAGENPELRIISELAAEKSRLAREELRATNPVAPDCVSVLRQLSMEFSLGLASSGSRASVELFLSSNGCAHLFQSILCGDDVNHAKPHPEIYQRTFATLGVVPRDAVVVEDAVAGIEAARTAGAGSVIGVEGTCSASQLSDAGASAVIRGVSELRGILCDAYENAVGT